MNIITSTNNDNIKLLRKLIDKKYRYDYSLFIAEGETLVNSIKDINSVHSLYVKESSLTNVQSIIDRYNGPKYLISDSIYDKSVETVTPSGIAAIMHINRKKLSKPLGNSLILDGISDPGNLGTIIRTAVACSYNDIYIINCTDPYSGKVIRSSMGGIFNVRLYEISYIDVDKLFNDVEIIALDMNGINIYDYSKLDKKYAIIVGNEAHGVSCELLDRANTIISLPMSKEIESLNAAVACSVTMYLLGGKK